MALVFLFIHLLFALLIFFLAIAFITGAPYVPSNNKSSNSMIKLANIKKGQTIIDLGSGDGKLLFLAEKKGAKKVIGYEINPFLAFFTYIKVLCSGKKNRIHVYWKNMWNADVSQADAVLVYLLPWKMKKLQKKLIRELKPGTLVISNSFIFPGWNIYKQDADNHVYVFKIKA